MRKEFSGKEARRITNKPSGDIITMIQDHSITPVRDDGYRREKYYSPFQIFLMFLDSELRYYDMGPRKRSCVIRGVAEHWRVSMEPALMEGEELKPFTVQFFQGKILRWVEMDPVLMLFPKPDEDIISVEDNEEKSIDDIYADYIIRNSNSVLLLDMYRMLRDTKERCSRLSQKVLESAV